MGEGERQGRAVRVCKCCHNSAEKGLLRGAGNPAGQGLRLSTAPAQPRGAAAARRGAARPSLRAAIGAAGLGWAAGRGAAQSAGRQQVAALRTGLRAPLRSASPRRLAEAPAAAKTPRAVLRVKNGAAKLAKPPAAAAGEAPGGAPGSGLFMERSQSRLSLSASFEALAIYFPCMNSFDEEDAGTGRGDGCGEARPLAAPCGRAVRDCACPSVSVCPSVSICPGLHGVRGSRRGRAGLCGACGALLPHQVRRTHRVRWAGCCKGARARIKEGCFFTRSPF